MSGMKFTRRVQSVAPVPDYVVDNESEFVLYVADTVINGIREYCGRDSESELGGFLIGKRHQTDTRIVVDVTSFVPVDSLDRGAGHFTFDETALLGGLTSQIPSGSERIGWFHSHPSLGDPFMSSADLQVHKLYFRYPYYVGCVVATGEWALPVGFWRLVNDEFRSVGTYYLRMTPTDPVGEQSRRLLGACLTTQVELPVSLKTALLHLRELGVIVDETAVATLNRILATDLPDALRLSSVTGVNALFDLGITLGAAVEANSNLRPLLKELRKIRQLNDHRVQLIKYPLFRGVLSSSDTKCFTVDLEEKVLCMGFYATNKVVAMPMILGASRRFVSASMTDAGGLYILMEGGVVAYFENVDLIKDDIGYGTRMKARIKQFFGGSDCSFGRIASRNDVLILQASEGVFRIPENILSAGDGSLKSVVCVVPAREGCDLHLVEGVFDDGNCAVLFVDGAMQAFDQNGSIICQIEYDPTDLGYSIAKVVAANAGLVLLLHRDGASCVDVRDARTLEMRYRYIGRSMESGVNYIDDIATDKQGQIYCKSGDSIFRLT